MYTHNAILSHWKTDRNTTVNYVYKEHSVLVFKLINVNKAIPKYI